MSGSRMCWSMGRSARHAAAALVRRPAAAAGLRRLARPAVDHVAATVGREAAVEPELEAGLRRARAAADARHAAAAAGLSGRARAAVELVAAAVAGRAALDALRRARDGRARP